MEAKTGLASFGNTCFLNSPVQCLLHTQELVDYFSREEQDEKGHLAVEFGKLLRDMCNSAGDVVRPVSFKSAVAKIAPQFGGQMQNDAQEFLDFLLNRLHQDLSMKSIRKVKASASRTLGNKEQSGSIISDVFQGQYRSTVCCDRCSNVCTTYETFLQLSLPVPEDVQTVKVTVVGTDTIRTVAVPIGRGRLVDLAEHLGKVSVCEAEHLQVLVLRNKREVLLDMAVVIEAGDIVLAFTFESQPSEEEVVWLKTFFEDLPSSSAKKLGKLVASAPCEVGRAMAQRILEYLKSGRRFTGSSASLYSSLEDFLAEETVDHWSCSHCKSQVQATRKLDLWKLPKILILHLNRFTFRGSEGMKIETRIDLPIDDLDIGKYIEGARGGVFELYAVMEHNGDFSSAHYTSTIRLRDKGWFRFDDASVTSVLPPATSDSAYVLFYMRKEA